MAELQHPPPGPVRVVVVDDHEVVRIGLSTSLVEAGGAEIDVVAAAHSAGELAAVLDEYACDVVVLDLALDDGTDPAETIAALVANGQRVLIYSIAEDARAVRRALAAGAHGLSRKSEPLGETVRKIRAVAAGEVLVSPEILAAIDGDLRFVGDRLSARERQVLVSYASGLEIPQIARELYITENSAKEYLRRIRLKYSDADRPASTKVELLRRAIEDGIVPPIQAL